MNMSFTDKELQIAAQLAYFSFSDDMKNLELRDLFDEPDIHKTSLKLTVYELMEMKAKNQIDYNTYKQFMEQAQLMLAYELEKMGVNNSVSYVQAKSILNGYSTGFENYQLWSNLEKIGISLDDNIINGLYLPDPKSFEEGIYSAISAESALVKIKDMRDKGELTPNSYQRYVLFSQDVFKDQLEALGIDKGKCENYSKEVLNQSVLGS